MAEVVIQPKSLHPLLDYSVSTKILWIAAVRNAEGCSLQQIGLPTGISLICLVTLLRSRSNTAQLEAWAVQSWYRV